MTWLSCFIRSQNPYTEPIWISNQLANDSFERHSGVIDWPGSSMPVNNHRPDKSTKYDPNRTFESALKQIFDWFRDSESARINFGAIYHPEPDNTGRRFSTNKKNELFFSLIYSNMFRSCFWSNF